MLSPSAPNVDLVTLYKSSAGWKNGPARCERTGGAYVYQGNTLRIPMHRDWVIGPNTWDGNKPNAGTGILMPNGTTIMQIQPFARCNKGGYATAKNPIPRMVEIDGDGIRGAHGGSGLSSIGGAIRCGEFKDGIIRHAMKINLFGKDAISRTGNGYRWPAVKADTGYTDAGANNYYNGKVPALRMGALLALRPTDYARVVSGFKTGTSENSPAVILARAFRDYGAYVVDNTARPRVDIVTEWGPTCRVEEEFKAQYDYPIVGTSDTNWGQDWNRILQNLHVVDNNSVDNPGGGPYQADGRGRRAPLAPKLR